MNGMKKLQGFSLGSMMVWAIGIGVILVLGFKLVPVYTEYFAVKQNVAAIVKEQNGAPISQIREAFGKRAQIDSISSIHSDDLDIQQDKDGTTVRAEYSALVPLVANVSLKFDFKTEAHSGAPQ